MGPRHNYHISLLSALVVLSLGCSSAIQKHLNPVKGLKAQLVVIYPFGFRWSEPAYRSFELSHRLIESTLSGKHPPGVRLMGPSEYRVYKQDDDRIWASSDLVSLLPQLHIQPSDVLVLRPWADRSSESNSKEAANASGKVVGVVRNEDITYHGHVDVIHPATETRVAELSGDAHVDPFAVREDDSDPTPELTHLMEQLTSEALQALSSSLDSDTSVFPLGFTYFFNPQAALDYQESGGSSLAAELASKDPLESDLIRINLIRYSNPGLTDAEAARLSHLAGGIVVRSVQSGSTLAEGDLITNVDQKPALPETLDRARYAQRPVRLRVQHASGGWMDLAWTPPPPEQPAPEFTPP